MKELKYKSLKWDKRSEELVKINSFNSKIEMEKKVLDEFNESSSKDYVVLYNMLTKLYYPMAEYSYIVNNDLEKFMGYLHLCVEAYSISHVLLEKGHATNMRVEKNINVGFEFATYCAVSLDDLETAKKLANNETAISYLLFNDLENAKKMALSMKNDGGIRDIVLAIADKSVDDLERNIMTRINIIRKQPIDYMIIIDIWSLALIKLANRIGIRVNTDIIEIPPKLVNNEIKINCNEWKLPYIEQVI